MVEDAVGLQVKQKSIESNEIDYLAVTNGEASIIQLKLSDDPSKGAEQEEGDRNKAEYLVAKVPRGKRKSKKSKEHEDLDS